MKKTAKMLLLVLLVIVTGNCYCNIVRQRRALARRLAPDEMESA